MAGPARKSPYHRPGSWALVAAVVAALGVYLVRPVPLDFVDREKTIVVFGTTSHMLPLIRVCNAVLHPFRRTLIPIEWEAMRKEAVANVGGEHDDFGNLTDWAAFERYVTAVDERAHFCGRAFMKDMLVTSMTTHLTLAKKVRDNPEILDEKIEAPIFLAAYTRAGATFLYQVLAASFDQELVPNYQYEVFGGPVQLPHKPPRKEETAQVINALHTMNPALTLMHEWTGPDDADEDSGWYLNTMRGVASAFNFPSLWHHLNIYEESSAEINKNFWETVLKIKQWEARRKLRFLLKAPDHLFGLPYLSEAFPDARFVTVSRDEGPMFRSGLALTHSFRRMFVEPRVNESIAMYDLLICHERKALAVAHGDAHRSRVLRVRFEDGLFTNTFEIVARFAKHADLPWDEAKQAHARRAIADRLAWKKTKARYRMSDFGLDDDAIDTRHATICDDLPDTVEGLRRFYNLEGGA